MESLEMLEELRRVNASFLYSEPVRKWKNEGRKVIG
jgi:hypothetical protein